MDYEREQQRHGPEGARRRAGAVHLLGSGHVAEGAEGADCPVRRLGGEEYTRVPSWFISGHTPHSARPRAATTAATAIEPDSTRPRDSASTASELPYELGSDVILYC